MLLIATISGYCRNSAPWGRAWKKPFRWHTSLYLLISITTDVGFISKLLSWKLSFRRAEISVMEHSRPQFFTCKIRNFTWQDALWCYFYQQWSAIMLFSPMKFVLMKITSWFSILSLNRMGTKTLKLKIYSSEWTQWKSVKPQVCDMSASEVITA